MGNNHDQYFGKNKRKVLVLGFASSGKASLIASISTDKNTLLKKKDLRIHDQLIDNLHVTFFILAGSERQRVFWKQHYEGTQGIIFVIDCSSSEQDIDLSFNQLKKFNQFDSLSDISFAICLNKTDLVNRKVVQSLKNKAKSILNNFKSTTKIFQVSLQTPDSSQGMIKWLVSKTKPF